MIRGLCFEKQPLLVLGFGVLFTGLLNFCFLKFQEVSIDWARPRPRKRQGGGGGPKAKQPREAEVKRAGECLDSFNRLVH